MPEPSDPYAEAAERAVADFPITVRELSLIARAENITFRAVDSDGERYALRLHRPGYHTLAELESEHAWIEALVDAGIRVPEPLTTRDGKRYACVDVPARSEQRHASLSRWMPGSLLMPLMQDGTGRARLERYFERLGALVATMNNVAADWQTPMGFERHALDAAGLMGDDPFWGRFWERPDLAPEERALLIEVRDRLFVLLSGRETDPGRYGIIHADLHPGNVLVDDDALTPIDFDDIAYGWYMYDLAVALHQCQHLADFPDFYAAAIRGYCAVRPVSAEELAMVPVFLLVRGMAEIGWFADRPENATPAELAEMKDFTLGQCRDFLANRLCEALTARA